MKIESRNLVFHYRRNKVLDGISFCLEKGEVAALLGHNGAGKTTLMRMLSGELEPAAGEVLLNGENLHTHQRRLASSIGYLPENPPYYPELSVIEYLDYAAGMQGVAPANRRQAINRVLDKTGLAPVAMNKIASLSRGYRQRVSLAQALVHEPGFVMLDEPTNGLDPLQSSELHALLRSLSAETAILIATHQLADVEQVCDRILLLRSGRLAMDCRTESLGDQSEIVIETSMHPGLLENNPAGLAIQFSRFDEQLQLYRYRMDVSRLPAADRLEAKNRMAQFILQQGAALYTLDARPLSLQQQLEANLRSASGSSGVLA